MNNAALFRNRRAVGLLAVGLVLTTASVVAWVAHSLIPGFSWSEGFLLGAIVAPTDAVATVSVMQTMHVPQRLNAIIEGESLVNDASSLIMYRFALASVLTGKFSLEQAVGTFVWTTVASIGLGIIIGWVVGRAHRFFNRDTVSNTAITLLTPYAGYLLAENLQVSGVLTVVAAGLWVSEREVHQFSSQSRLQATSVWDTLVFGINSFIFIVLGLQLPDLISRLHGYAWSTVLSYVAAVTGVAIAVRLLWVWPSAYLPFWLVPALRHQSRPPFQHVLIVGWAGMRGVVSLAAALALPINLTGNTGFPNRDLIVLQTFGVISSTLLGQGLSLAGLINWLKVNKTVNIPQQEHNLRRAMFRAALHYLDRADTRGDDAQHLQRIYQYRLDHLDGAEKTNQNLIQNANPLHQRVYLHLRLLQAERETLTGFLTHDTSIDGELVRRLLLELDLEAARLSSLTIEAY